MQETYTCTATYVMKHSLTLCCTVKKFETIFGTLIMYLLDGDTFDTRIQCYVLKHRYTFIAL